MNYVERHFGDWARDTAHLSMLEDGAYNRLVDLYYVRESPLPLDLAACCRLVRAVTKAEREAVRSVLAEFFSNGAEGWTHKRCDIEIERFRTKSRKASASANARWDADRSHSDGTAEADANAMRTHSGGNASGMPHAGERGRAPTPHFPVANLQSSEAKLPTVVAPRPKASKRCPEGFEVTDAMRTAITVELPGVDIDKETAKFRDHTFATARTDWPATWRNWMRTAAEKVSPGRANGFHAKQQAIEQHNDLVGEAWERRMAAEDERAH